MSSQSLTTVLAIVFTGLSAGLLFGWRVSVIPGTARSSDRTYIEAMGHINAAIINPIFILVFLGAPVLQLVAVIRDFDSSFSSRAWTEAAALIVYVVGVFGVTAVGNIPINNRLAAFDLDNSSDDELKSMRTAIERPWNRWHNLRTIAAVASFALMALAPVVYPDFLWFEL